MKNLGLYTKVVCTLCAVQFALLPLCNAPPAHKTCAVHIAQRVKCNRTTHERCAHFLCRSSVRKAKYMEINNLMHTYTF
jgi:hypothetical protein